MDEVRCGFRTSMGSTKIKDLLQDEELIEGFILYQVRNYMTVGFSASLCEKVSMYIEKEIGFYVSVTQLHNDKSELKARGSVGWSNDKRAWEYGTIVKGYWVFE